MVPHDFSKKISTYFKLGDKKLREIFINSLSLIKEFKGTVFFLFFWVLISEMAGYPVLLTFRSIFRLIIYPLNWILFKTQFKITEIPQVFLLLIPLFLLVVISFIIIISTED